jgi:transcription termination factor Rho
MSSIETEKEEQNTAPTLKKEGRQNNNGRWNRPRGPSQRQPMLSPDVPIYDINLLNKLKVSELQSIAKYEGVRHYWSTPRHALIVEIIKQQLRRGAEIKGCGVIEATQEHHGFIRSEEEHLQSLASDPFIPIQIMRQYQLSAGVKVVGTIRQQEVVTKTSL